MLFYELIQIALGLRNSLSYSPSEQEWETMFETAQKQAVAGIVFSAIEKQSDNGAKPPISLLYEWIEENQLFCCSPPLSMLLVEMAHFVT